MISEKYALAKLRIANQNFVEATPHDFALTLCAYLDELVQQQKNASINNHAHIEKDRDTRPEAVAREKLLEALTFINNETDEYCKKNNINLNTGFMGLTDISEFQALAQGKTQLLEVNLMDREAESNLIEKLMQVTGQRLQFLLPKGMDKEVRTIAKKYGFLGADENDYELKLSSAEDLDPAYNDLLQHLQLKKILHPSLQEYLDEYKDAEINPDKKQHKRRYQNASLLSLFKILPQDYIYSAQHLEFVERFAHVTAAGGILELKNASLIIEWRNERSRLERIKGSSFWNGWEKLNRFHLVYKDCEHLRTTAQGKLDFIADQKLYKDFNKIQAIAEGKETEYARFCEPNLKSA